MKPILYVYFLLSGVTWAISAGGQSMLGRVAVGDLWLLPLLAGLLFLHPNDIRIPRLARYGLALLLTFLLGLLNSENMMGSLVEWLVHVYVFLGFVVIYSIMVARPMDERFDMVLWAVRMGSLLAVVGTYEFAAGVMGLPSLFVVMGRESAATNAVVGTFRNTGQAGAFFVTFLALAVAMVRCTSGRRRTEVVLHSLMLALAMMLTVKRAALIAFVAGLLLMVLMERGWRGRAWTTIAVCLVLAGAIPAFNWAVSQSSSFQRRVERKLGKQGAETFGTFAMSNVEAATRAFEAHPLTGVGLGGVAGVYSERYEIHSTYLAVPASAGIPGAVMYVLFIFALFESTTRTRNGDPRARLFGRTLRPLLLGLMLSYAYTYHLRKREFWILAAVASAVMAPDRALGLSRRGPLRGTVEDPAIAGPPAALAGVG